MVLSVVAGSLFIDRRAVQAPDEGETETATTTQEVAQEPVETKLEAYRVPFIPQAHAASETCLEWMIAAGISDIPTATILINKESGCNPNAVNRFSGACGIGQQLPCGKWPHQWNEPVGALVDMQNYVYNRYGTWDAALNFHNRNNWY